MPSNRKFYRSVIQVEVLSEEPVDFDDLTEVDYQITEGDCSGFVTDVVTNEEVDGVRMAKLLEEQGSDPGFFGLDAEGNDADDDPIE